jgi:hypothetical protein
LRKSLLVKAVLTASVLLCAAGPVSAQFGLRDLARMAGAAGVSAPNLRKEPISTSLADAQWGDSSKDDFSPRQAKRQLMELQRTPNGGFLLEPGYFTFHAQSYCLHAGTHGPGEGDGYLYAPPLGAAKDAVMAIVRNSVQHPEIEQRTIQSLLWAILARAKVEDLSTDLKLAASRLLTPRQLASLNRNVLDMLSEGPIADNLPSELRQVLQAEADLRRMLTAPGTSYAQLEQVAVLAGMAPLGAGSMQVPAARWSHHPDGYWVRYLPSSYTNTVVEIWVPDEESGAGKEYDPATHIAVPGNTARQRLMQSARPYTS